MSTQRIVGIVLLIVGILLLVIGLNASDSIGDQISKTFTGKWTDNTAWYMYGGLALALFGTLSLAFGGRGKLA